MKNLVLFILLSFPVLAQYSALGGNCEQGGNTIVTSGFNSSTYVQQSFPSCTVTVYQGGTTTLATIYNTSSGGAQANPFVAGPDGSWVFYGTSANYTLNFSGLGILIPFTRQVSIGGSGGGGSSFLTNGVANTTQTGLNLINSSATNGLTLTFTNPSGSTAQLGLSGALTSSGMSTTGAAGFYTNPSITVDAAGRITSASSGSGFVYPSIGIPTSTGSAWGSSYSLASLTVALGACSSSLQGMLPPTGGGTTNYLRADCTFQPVPSQIYPGVGIPQSTGSSWNSSLTLGTTGSDLCCLLSSGLLPVSVLPAATASTLGVVQPDNVTITISGGIISATGGSGSNYPIYSKTSNTVATFGTGQFQLFGGYNVSTVSCTATFSGTSSTDVIWVYWSGGSGLNIGYNGTETITGSSGCNPVLGISAQPPGTYLLYSIPITTPNTWPSGATYLGGQGLTVVEGSSGITCSYSFGIQTCITDPLQVPRYSTGSGNPSSTCTTGRDLYTDITGLNLWFCTATNTWAQANGSTLSALTGVPLWPFGRGPGNSATATISANQVVTYLFRVDYPTTFSGSILLQFDNDGAHTAFGIYSLVGSLLEHTVTRTGSGVLTNANLSWSSSFTLQPGGYYLAFTTDTSAARIMQISDPNSIVDGIDNQTGTIVLGICSNSSTGTSTLTFPATCGTQTTQAAGSIPPYVVFK